MGKARTICAAAALTVAAALAPRQTTIVRAQASPPLSCSNQPTVSPMQGHYSGSWHSDADYHFAAFGTDIELKVTIDGTLDVAVSSSGAVSGIARGTVDAPIYDYGRHDVSSGYGTISGPLTGTLVGTNATLTLLQPIIDMHWGTFVGGGATVLEHIAMPNYQLLVAGKDCVSGSGAISEQGFPSMNLVADGTGQLTQAPGIGAAGGTWQLTSDQTSMFNQLSQQVDSFISQSNTLLADSNANLTAANVDQRILQPLRALQATIRQNPNVARCLLDRLGAWEASSIPALFTRVQTLASDTELISMRQAGDLLRRTQILNTDCSLPDNGVSASLLAMQRAALDRAIASKDWPRAALLLREIVLLQGDAIRAPLQLQTNLDIHNLLQSANIALDVADIGRVSYALGDSLDATAAGHWLTTHKVAPVVASRLAEQPGKKPVKHHRKKHKPKPAPTALPSATPTATPTPKPLSDFLSAGVSRITVHASSDQPPVFSWQPVTGATRYTVAITSVQDPALVWSWSGRDTSVAYGDTAIEGAIGSDHDGWPVALGPSGYTWSVLAYDAQNRVVGVRLGTRL